MPYHSRRTPATIDPREIIANPHEGGNCESFFGALTLSRGFYLPPEMRALELYHDTEYTEIIESLSDVKTGDAIGLFMGERPDDLKHAHVGAAVVEGGKIHLLHGAKHNGQVVLELLTDVLDHERYGGLAWIRRPNVRGPVIAPAAKT